MNRPIAKYFGALTAALLLCTSVPASAATTSAKATAQINTMVGCTVTNSAGNPAPMTCHDIFSGAAAPVTPDNFATIMSTPVQLSSSQSVFASSSMETGLYTNTAVTGNGSKSTAIAEGGVFLRAVLVDSAGKVIVADPIAACSDMILGCFQDTNSKWGVTLDQRIQTLTATLSGCIAQAGGNNCNTAEFIQLILQTTSAHTFNFIFPNVGQGTYTLEIQVAVNSAATVSGSGSSIGAAAFGLGDVTVDVVRLVHGFSF